MAAGKKGVNPFPAKGAAKGKGAAAPPMKGKPAAKGGKKC